MISTIFEWKSSPTDLAEQLGVRLTNSIRKNYRTSGRLAGALLESPRTSSQKAIGVVGLGAKALLIKSKVPLRPSSLTEDFRSFPNSAVDVRLPSLGPGGAGEDIPPSWAMGHWQVSLLSSQALTGRGIKIGIIDTGIDLTHPAFDANDRGGRVCAIASLSRDGVLDGIAAASAGLSPSDVHFNTYSHWHGTHCASILSGARIANGGGVAPGVDLYVAKVLDKYNQGTVASIYAGFDWLARQKCDIVSASLGWEGYRDQWAIPIQALISTGAVVVAASGNEYGIAGLGQTRSPANYPFANYGAFDGELISVGAVDENDAVWARSGGELSDWPQTYTDDDGNPRPSFFAGAPRHMVPSLVGPGVDISSAVPGGGYALSSGTSMAVPFIAGLLALVLEKLRQRKSNSTAKEAMAILRESVRDLHPEGIDSRSGAGRPEISLIVSRLFA